MNALTQNEHNVYQLQLVPKSVCDELERKLKDTEIRKKNVEEEHERTLSILKEEHERTLSILKEERERTSVIIQTHINTEIFLRNENEKLKTKIAELNVEIAKLKTIIAESNAINIELKTTLEKIQVDECKKTKLLKINQCIYDYKEKIWEQIFKTDVVKKRKNLKCNNDLLDVLKGNLDNKLSDEQIENRKNVVNNIKKNYDIIYLFNSFKDFTGERNQLSHPKIEKTELQHLKIDFLNYCNKQWGDDDDDDKENEKFTNYIFDVLKS